MRRSIDAQAERRYEPMSDVFTAQTRGRLTWLLGGALVGVMAAVVVGPSFGPGVSRAASDASNPEHSISVSGSGTVKVKPDVADVSFGVTVQKDKAKDASQAAAEQMTKVVDALKAAGVADNDIQTQMISLQPIYDYTGSLPRLQGYQSDNQVDVTIRDLTKAGETIDAAVAAGANNVSGITFRVNDQDAANAQARDAAMKDAKSKADALASAAGVSITGVISITDVSSPSQPPIYYGREAGAAVDATTPVQPGKVDMEVTVTVVYSIP
jgi:uncharacterized protein